MDKPEIEIDEKKFIEMRNNLHRKHGCHWMVGLLFEMYDERNRQEFLKCNIIG